MAGTILLRDASDLFEHRIWERAKAYRDAGRVEQPTQITPNLWHARVNGSFVYDVDVRLRRGKLVSAACTCPYAQKHMYCKHVGAVLLALHDMDESSDGKEHDRAHFPHDASQAVDEYWCSQLRFIRQERISDLMENDDWKAISRILERLYDMPDITQYRDAADKQRVYSKIDVFKDDKTSNMRLLTPMFHCDNIDDLPHGWLTILEATYEHLHNAEGLRMLYSLYILLARTYPEAVYVPKLREISGDHWREDCETIVEGMNANPLNMLENDNPAYERLIQEEHLIKAAKSYCCPCLTSANAFSLNDRSLRMLELLAEAEPDTVRRRYVKLLQQPDSSLYKEDTAHQAKRVAAWVRRLEDVYGEEISIPLARNILDMFPNRQYLQRELSEYRVREDNDE